MDQKQLEYYAMIGLNHERKRVLDRIETLEFVALCLLGDDKTVLDSKKVNQ